MIRTKFWLSILAISVVLIAGSLAVSPIAIADDDDDDDDDDDNGLLSGAGISTYTKSQTITTTGGANIFSVSVMCDPGDIATGGGASIPNPPTTDTNVRTSEPIGPTSAPNGWLAKSLGSGPGYDLTVHVVCADITP